MPYHRRLLTIIFGKGRCLSGCDEIKGVGADGVDALGMDVLEVLVRQFEARAELGFFQGG
jgi:hypothetical protein